MKTSKGQETQHLSTPKELPFHKKVWTNQSKENPNSLDVLRMYYLAKRVTKIGKKYTEIIRIG